MLLSTILEAAVLQPYLHWEDPSAKIDMPCSVLATNNGWRDANNKCGCTPNPYPTLVGKHP